MYGMLDPTGGERTSAMITTLAPRVPSLRGRTLALVDNGKPNGAALLGALAEVLTAQHGLGDHRFYVKPSPATPIDDSMRATIARECDVALAAVGD